MRVVVILTILAFAYLGSLLFRLFLVFAYELVHRLVFAFFSLQILLPLENERERANQVCIGFVSSIGSKADSGSHAESCHKTLNELGIFGLSQSSKPVGF